MPLSWLVTWIALSACVYRVTRFIIRDTLIEGVRDKFLRWLLPPPSFTFDMNVGVMPEMPKAPAWWRTKLHELLTCPYCVGIWVSAVGTAITDAFISVPLPVFMWVAASTGSLAFWRYVEDD